MTANHCDARAIADLVARQDGDALTRIAECYLGYLLGVGRCACRDPDRAADAVQDALESAATRLDQYRGDGSVKAWLARMVVNACRCGERGRKNDPAWNHPLSGDEPAARGDAAAERELSRLMAAALALLDDRDRDLFLLSQVDGATAPELAEIFGCTPDAVRARLTRIRRRLRRELEPVWADWR